MFYYLLELLLCWSTSSSLYFYFVKQKSALVGRIRKLAAVSFYWQHSNECLFKKICSTLCCFSIQYNKSLRWKFLIVKRQFNYVNCFLDASPQFTVQYRLPVPRAIKVTDFIDMLKTPPSNKTLKIRCASTYVRTALILQSQTIAVL